MRRKNNKIIFIDLEATCWDGKQNFEDQEIIEIGFCSLMNFDYTIKNKQSILVQPKNDVSEYCSELTGITNEMLKKDGISLNDALYKLKKNVSKYAIWGGWGDFELKMLKKAYRENNIEFPFSDDYIDFKRLCSFIYGAKSGVSLKTFMNELKGISFETPQHRALPDAINTAKIFKKLTEGRNEF